jgi:hypothetical protein
MKKNFYQNITITILALLLLFPGSFGVFRYLATDYSNNVRNGDFENNNIRYSYYSYSQNHQNQNSYKPTYTYYKGQYETRNYPVIIQTNQNYNSQKYNYYNNRIMKTTTQNQFFRINNALDYTYYKNPQLFATRYIDNRQRYYRTSPQWI